MFGIATVPSILLALGMAFSPESPRWLFQVFLLYSMQSVVIQEIPYSKISSSEAATSKPTNKFILYI